MTNNFRRSCDSILRSILKPNFKGPVYRLRQLINGSVGKQRLAPTVSNALVDLRLILNVKAVIVLT